MNIKTTFKVIYFALAVVGCFNVYNVAVKIIPCIEKYGLVATCKMIF